MLDVMVRGLGPEAIWKPFLLLAFAAAVTLMASRFFQWEAD